MAELEDHPSTKLKPTKFYQHYIYICSSVFSYLPDNLKVDYASLALVGSPSLPVPVVMDKHSYKESKIPVATLAWQNIHNHVFIEHSKNIMHVIRKIAYNHIQTDVHCTTQMFITMWVLLCSGSWTIDYV